jgi:predicted ATP-grasp superfamily ATP-dependent carboligase
VGEAVLIAAYSGRALAQSARRAGYDPLVADVFGDLDMREAAAGFRVIEGAMQVGFRTKPLIAALDDLSRSASAPPIGLVLGSGFEDKPRLVAALDSRYRLLGSDAATLDACKDPAKFFATLDSLHVGHPETQTAPPADTRDWISKRVGGSGGRHIRICRGRQFGRPRRYFQKLLEGERLSIGALFAKRTTFGGGGFLVAITRQWISPTSEQPFRFGGAVSRPDVDQDLYARLAASTSSVGAMLGLVGMASFDFIVSGGSHYLLEVNPRPGASLDVLDEEDGHLFSAHIDAWNGVCFSPGARPSRPARAAAILHADRGPILLGDTPWPEWSADRGAAGSFVPEGAPLATAFADAPTADAAEALARTRLAELEDLIYGHARS